MTTIENVISGLKSIGYKVNLSPQEAIGAREVVITLEELDIEVETSQCYFYTQTYALNWYADNIVTIVSTIQALISAVEASTVATARNFKFITPDITREGTAYLITLKFQFTETIST
jgi:hypothetical protein